MNLASNYPLVARSTNNKKQYSFSCNGIEFSQQSFNIFAGLNAVDNRNNVELTFRALNQLGLNCARMGAFKPRTSPYSFQGLGVKCLDYVFELAVEYAIKIIAMEITHEDQINSINSILAKNNNPTKVMLQVGTRNAQNFELLKAIGKQNIFPILYKRGFGISLEESIAACEYLAYHGNDNIIFCLRGMKSNFAAPHRNFADVAHIPVIKRLTKMPVCFDPSHAIGNLGSDLDGIPDLWHANAQAITAGTNMLLIDIHPSPCSSLVDAPQAIALQDLDRLLIDIKLCRELYLRRIAKISSMAYSK